MSLHSSLEVNLVQPTHCFCMISDSEMAPWIIKKYRDHISTLDLMLSTTDPHEKEVISIVALIDVDDTVMLRMMQNVDRTDEHILECRLQAKELVETIIA